MAVTNKQILDAIESMRQEELADIKEQIKTMNGRVRMTEQAVASFQTWRHDHGKDVHDAQDAEIQSLRSKTNMAAMILATGQVIIAAVGAALFGGKQP